MEANKEISVVIPCKNEEEYMWKLLDSLLNQSYPMQNVSIYIADADSTDNTRQVINGYKSKLKISIIRGGLPSYGRNAGAKRCKTKYILFIDADVVLSRRAIDKSLALIKKKNIHCVTANIFCNKINPLANAIYIINDIFQYLSKLDKPYSSGMFMLFERKKFEELGGFNEKVLYAEDYFLTKQLKRDKFSVAPTYILATNRRFKKMGYLKIIKLFICNALRGSDDNYFFKDKGYWDAKFKS